MWVVTLHASAPARDSAGPLHPERRGPASLAALHRTRVVELLFIDESGKRTLGKTSLLWYPLVYNQCTSSPALAQLTKAGR